jgi:SAM-dependent methyltransferase
VSTQPPRPDESDVSGGEGRPLGARDGSGILEALAGRGGIAPHEVDLAARSYWEAEADTYQARHGAFLAGAPRLVVDSVVPIDGIDHHRQEGTVGAGFVWGPEGVTEAELGLLGPVDGLQGRLVLEVGCGAAQCSAWLARQGAHAVGVDIAVNQLRHAPQRRPGPVCRGHWQGEDLAPDDRDGLSTQDVRRPDSLAHGGGAGPGRSWDGGWLHVAAATATALPFGDDTFDVAFASYGAVQFVADLPRLLAEVRRVLAPGGRWVFSVTHPIRWAFPDDPGPDGLTATGSYFDRAPYVERDGAGHAIYAEFHRTLGDYVAALRAAGFDLESLVEPEWPAWNLAEWGGWSPLRGAHLPGTMILGCRAH